MAGSKGKRVLAKLSESAASLQSPAQPPNQPTPVPQNLNVNEFYKTYIKPKKITARPDIAVFFVYYLEKILKKETVPTADVTQCFADVSYPGYNNLNMTDILNQAKRKALLNNVNKLWSLTITGEDFVLNTLSGEKQ